MDGTAVAAPTVAMQAVRLSRPLVSTKVQLISFQVDGASAPAVAVLSRSTHPYTD